MPSVQDKLQRVRRPRVHIKYEVETDGARVEKELPFVVGVMGDFSGDGRTELPPLSERAFQTVDRDTFDQVLAAQTPKLNFHADDVISEKSGDAERTIPVNLEFSQMVDFEPASVVQQVEPLRRLKEKRDKLRDLLAKADGSRQLENLLEEVLADDAELTALARELGVESNAGGDGEDNQ